MTMEEKPKHETFTVPVNESPYDRLTEYARRTVVLLEDPVVQQSEEMKSSLDELLGSIYSLITAHKLDYEDRITKKKEDSVILNVGEELSQGVVRIDGKRVAGYFMNSATYRTSSVYHRLLKIVTGTANEDIGKLLPLAGAAFKDWTGGKQWSRNHLDRVRDEANRLKHSETALYRGRTLWKEYGIAAIAQLLTLAETWVAQQTKVKAPGIPKMKSPAKGKA